MPNTETPPLTTPDFRLAKQRRRRLSMVTCYDYTFARLLSQTPIDALLVGDSAGMVVHGHRSTLPMTTDLIRLHTEAVVRGAGGKFVVADMPFLSFRKGVGPALEAAHQLMSAGAHALKLEGLDGHEDVITRLVESGIPVMGHLGLQPQAVNAAGGFRVQGRSPEAAARIAHQAQTLEHLGVFAIVLECVPAKLAQDISTALQIPTIGIGAGSGCDGQVLVLHDLLGLNPDFQPRFARRFTPGAEWVNAAIANFDAAVKSGDFPAPAESYT